MRSAFTYGHLLMMAGDVRGEASGIVMRAATHQGAEGPRGRLPRRRSNSFGELPGIEPARLVSQPWARRAIGDRADLRERVRPRATDALADLVRRQRVYRMRWPVRESTDDARGRRSARYPGPLLQLSGAGGRPQTSTTARLLTRTSSVMRFGNRPSSTCGRCAPCAVVKSCACTAPSAAEPASQKAKPSPRLKVVGDNWTVPSVAPFWES